MDADERRLGKELGITHSRSLRSSVFICGSGLFRSLRLSVSVAILGNANTIHELGMGVKV
jgi:hypothetical protein